MDFKLKTNFQPQGDQSKAIEQLVKNLKAGVGHQVLHGVTGSGKTFTAASVIERVNRPTLIISHNKTLAWQLYEELKEFFPNNAVHYFVSYYDYYQPEAYLPAQDIYISKDASINPKIDAMRHGAVQSLLTRADTIIIASVSCIYNLGSPETYRRVTLKIREGQKFTRKNFLDTLVTLGFVRNDIDPRAGALRIRGGTIEIYPASGQEVIKISLEEEKIQLIQVAPIEDFNITKLEKFKNLKEIKLFPANFWTTPEDKLKIALVNIRTELNEHIKKLKLQGKELEANRIEQKTTYDLELIEQIGYCSGIENYSSHLEFRDSGTSPFTLLDYFPKEFLTIIDESHITIPQIRGMHAGDRARKKTLIEYGFRLPSALDNRPLDFREFDGHINQTIYMSATPQEYELEKAGRKYIAEQIIRPTGLLDPPIEVRSAKNQMADAITEIKKAESKDQRTLVVTITKRLAEDIAEYLHDSGLKVNYIHSEIKTLDRPSIMRKLRTGEYDVLVGVNLLREGLDLPEVALIIIFDADKEGFLRNETTLLQTMGRAARHIDGRTIMYADKITGSMRAAIKETKRRRKIQQEHNETHGITPRSIQKTIHDIAQELEQKNEGKTLAQEYKNLTRHELQREMKRAARELDFEKAAQLRDELRKINS